MSLSTRSLLFACMLLAGAFAASLANSETLVRLDASDGPEQSVQINLPLPLAERLLARVEVDSSCWFCDDGTVTRRQLRRILDEVSSAASGERVTLRVGADRFAARRDADRLVIDHLGRWWWNRDARIDLPVSVARAMTQSPGDGLDLQAGLRALAQEPDGRREILARERSGDSRLRLWIE